ncbi:putative membrane lipoprotein isoform X2 [Carex rostrata]
MRIRKTVSKLLGSAIVYPSHHSPPSSDLWAPPAIDTAGLICELNQSPWDVYPNLHLFNNNFQGLESSAISKKEEVVEETKEQTHNVISENTGVILENSDNPIRFCQKPTSKSSKKKNGKRKKKDAIILCKKNDGKKWFCKRPAQLPHSLCEYHLSQSRSYYNTNKAKEASEFEVGCEPNKQKQKPRENGGSGASPYYYYNGFGPSSRKRKGGTSSNGVGHDTMHVANEERLNGSDAPEADVDEEYGEEVAGELVSSPNEEEKRVPRKRGRKPVKCRSLKSLL